MTEAGSDYNSFFGATTNNINFANLSVLGIPRDSASSFRDGARDAPQYIRYATSNTLYNPFTETGRNIQQTWQIFDIGDAPITELDPLESKKLVFKKIAKHNKYGMRFLFLGGDHLSTYFTFVSLKKIQDLRMGLIYLDAHPDLYDNYNNDKYSHACVVKRIIDETNIEPKAIFQVGIRASTPEQQEYANNLGITTITTQDVFSSGAQAIAERIKAALPKKLDGVYLSIDMDVLDPAFAPGVGNPEPAGLTTRDVLLFLQALQGINFVAFDVVELCPKYDFSSISSFAAAKLIKEVLGVI